MQTLIKCMSEHFLCWSDSDSCRTPALCITTQLSHCVSNEVDSSLLAANFNGRITRTDSKLVTEHILQGLWFSYQSVFLSSHSWAVSMVSAYGISCESAGGNGRGQTSSLMVIRALMASSGMGGG